MIIRDIRYRNFQLNIKLIDDNENIIKDKIEKPEKIKLNSTIFIKII